MIGGNAVGVSLNASNYNTLIGNFLGIGSNGSTSVANTGSGVYLLDAQYNIFGGTTSGARNVVSSNGAYGFHLDSGSSYNVIQGNYIGTDATGLVDKGNVYDGIWIHGSSAGNRIGGSTSGAGNVISGNALSGINLDETPISGRAAWWTADGNNRALTATEIGRMVAANGASLNGAGNHTVQGNIIGRNATNTATLANDANGIVITSNRNIIGGTAAGEANIISGNGLDGVLVSSGFGNTINVNSTFANGSLASTLGIDLGTDGVSSNDGANREMAARERQRQSGITLFFDRGDGNEQCFVVNATPVFDGKEQVVGTLVSFEDVTTLEQQKQSLLQTMYELEASKEQIRLQNVRLQELASTDALTDTINRRTLFEQLEDGWAEVEVHGEQLCCIMLDVDHFKRLNDSFGHAVGDQVLIDVARILNESVGDCGIVGRYGGEEFCVIVPQLSVSQVATLSEKLRSAIATDLAQPYEVTASFGVSGSALGAKTFQKMLEQADQALYAAKNAGRNAVRVWSPQLAAEQEAQAANLLHMIADADQPVSYHAVAALHSALAYRDTETALHCQRVAEMSVAVGRGLMSVSELYMLEIAAILHDIGKLGVPDVVLCKPSALTDVEWKVMDSRFQMGVEIVDASFGSKALAEIIRYYHYRFDGIGAPAGAPVGENIPLGARIIAIVDSFDSMISSQVYRGSRTPDEAFKELQRCAGTQFDPKLVELFVKLQLGWRPDSSHIQEALDCRMAISIGHLTERTMYAFATHDRASLCEQLSKLATAGEQYELPAIQHLSHKLSKSIGAIGIEDWDHITPILQNLLEMCMMVQRAHVRDVAKRPQLFEEYQTT